MHILSLRDTFGGSMNHSMKHFVGMMLFFVAIGMLLMLFISSKVGAIILIAILMILGYWCLVCD